MASSAFAVKVADITRIGGSRTNVLTGLGLVIGLKGTGDGGAYLPAIRAAGGDARESSPIPPALPNWPTPQNVAIVRSDRDDPSQRRPQRRSLDVCVISNGAATSLKGGRLFVFRCWGRRASRIFRMMQDGNALRPMPYALAEGPVILEDPSTPTVGVVNGGAVMEVDLPAKYIDTAGRFTLILDDPSASWTMASTIAKLINEAGDTGETIAQAIDPKNVIVQIPAAERERPDSFISHGAAAAGADAGHRSEGADQRADRHDDRDRRCGDQPGGDQPQGADDHDDHPAAGAQRAKSAGYRPKSRSHWIPPIRAAPGCRIWPMHSIS